MLLINLNNALQTSCLLLSLILLNACAEQPKKSTVLIPVEERNVPLANKNNVLEQTQAESNKIKNEQTQPVIVALLEQAKEVAAQGETTKAAAIIERGLRIDSRNASLWHELALIRLQQQQWQQAVALARKSNALAAYDEKLKSANWGIIADAYEQLGQKEKAKQARKKQTVQG